VIEFLIGFIAGGFFVNFLIDGARIKEAQFFKGVADSQQKAIMNLEKEMKLLEDALRMYREMK
jgi:hypothetical protein